MAHSLLHQASTVNCQTSSSMKQAATTAPTAAATATTMCGINTQRQLQFALISNISRCPSSISHHHLSAITSQPSSQSSNRQRHQHCVSNGNGSGMQSIFAQMCKSEVRSHKQADSWTDERTTACILHTTTRISSLKNNEKSFKIKRQPK